MTIENGGRDISALLPYWSLAEKAEQGIHDLSDNVASLSDELDKLLRDSVGMRMISDVPLGAFLSGGFDSTMVVAQMQAQSSKPIKTFTIGFNEQGYNEATHAKVVANHLGTDHTELYVTPQQAESVIPKLPQIYDEPFSDSSQIPTFLVSELARQHVTVSLSGDGGDELFYGYGRYLLGDNVWRKLTMLPLPIRRFLAYILRHTPTRLVDNIQSLFPSRMQVSNLGDKLPKLADFLSHQSQSLFYRDLVSHWKNTESIVLGASEPRTIFSETTSLPKFSDARERMMFLDMMTYLPDDILTKVDRASMAVGLEARVPLLDHRLVEFAWKVPMKYKYRDGQAKWLFRQVLDRYVPRELMERPKMGFGVPIEHWLRGALSDWAESLLDEKSIKEDGIFSPEPIRDMWKQHKSGERRWHYYLWDVLMFQSWLEQE